MEYYVGVDVSLKESSVCVVDDKGKIVREAKAMSEPEALRDLISGIGFLATRIGMEAGPLSQWLREGLVDAGFEDRVMFGTDQMEFAETDGILDQHHPKRGLSDGPAETRHPL